MKLARVWAVARLDLAHLRRRPLFWIWLLTALFATAIASAGAIPLPSQSSTAGGIRPHITSEFANALELSILSAMFFTFFVAATAGLGVIRDGELRVEELLHATPLRAREYVWGKFGAALVAALLVLAVQLGLGMVFDRGLTGASHPELVGELSLGNYLLPGLVFALPLVLLIAGLAFAIGERSRRPALVNLVPLALLLVSLFFLWSWTPAWLDPRWDRALMWIEPTGYRWLHQTWLAADRGVHFYNTSSIAYDAPFLLSRLALAAIGLGAVAGSARHLARGLAGARVKPAAVQRALALAVPERNTRIDTTRPLAELAMTSRRPGFPGGLMAIARLELRELTSHPALWLFLPLVVLNATVDAIYATGVLDSRLLLTPGTSAVGCLEELTFTLCALLMFFTAESLHRERRVELDGIVHATPLRTGSLILGKCLANGVVGLLVLLAVFATCAALLLAQGTVPLEIEPYAIVFGLLIGPVVAIWTAFVALVYALSRSRTTTYGVAIVAMIHSAILLGRGEMTWVWNWSLTGALSWSDMGAFELDRTPLLLNRLLALATAATLVALAVQVFPRRDLDRARLLSRLAPGALLRGGFWLLPPIALILTLGIWLQRGIAAGPEGRRIERWAERYWRRNHATWLDAPLPDLARTDLELELDPARRWFRTRGSYELRNGLDVALERFPLTIGPHFEGLSWTLDGQPQRPEERQGLCVFRPTEPLAPGASCTVGFELEGLFLDGYTRNGGREREFILPSGVVLTSASPAVAPVLGYLESLGLDEERGYDAREPYMDSGDGPTGALFGPALPQLTRIRITAPEEYTLNSVGVLTGSTIVGGQRTVTWESDHPLDTWNIVGGRYAVRRGSGTAIYHHPTHTYNLDEMQLALDGARAHYSEWFAPYPWQELKLSEFPSLATYAQGFATNIAFSESAGFLVEAGAGPNAAFLITAHEAAHQWWGGLLIPGDGPGGNQLSEGLAHLSTLLLFEELKGLEQRIEFTRHLEQKYLEARKVDSERPLLQVDETRAGDTTLTYDKAAWAFWMLANHLGREPFLEGLRTFIQTWSGQRDHPLPADLLAHLRPLARDPEAYDELTGQWFARVGLPEYTLEGVAREPDDDVPGHWRVRLTVRNAGTGHMPIEVAAQRGARFSDGAYRESRATVELAAGARRELILDCEWKPERVVVDPDALVLQANRARALFRF